MIRRHENHETCVQFGGQEQHLQGSPVEKVRGSPPGSGRSVCAFRMEV